MSENVLPKKVFDYVFELPTYTELDYAGQADFFENEYSKVVGHGGCSAAMKTVNGETITARNLDFYISNRPAFVVRTEVPGAYKTVGTAYVPWFGPTYEETLAEGVAEKYTKLYPFCCSDILNEKGLYIELNMRTEEFHDGVPRYRDAGLNPGGERVSAISFVRYAAERCATVSDVLEMLKEIDYYSLSAAGTEWGFCYAIADATGNYGILEIAGDKVYFNQYQPVQTNMYLAPELAANQLYKSGLGRYNTLMANIHKVKSEQDMQKLIDLVQFSTQYTDPENCAFDVRHEYYDAAEGIDYAMLMDPANQEKLQEAIDKYVAWWHSLSRQEKQDDGTIWETSISTCTNVTKRTMHVRFFEDDERSLVLTF
jgi:hypothetical protein